MIDVHKSTLYHRARLVRTEVGGYRAGTWICKVAGPATSLSRFSTASTRRGEPHRLEISGRPRPNQPFKCNTDDAPDSLTNPARHGNSAADISRLQARALRLVVGSADQRF